MTATDEKASPIEQRYNTQIINNNCNNNNNVTKENSLHVPLNGVELSGSSVNDRIDEVDEEVEDDDDDDDNDNDNDNGDGDGDRDGDDTDADPDADPDADADDEKKGLILKEKHATIITLPEGKSKNPNKREKLEN